MTHYNISMIKSAVRIVGCIIGFVGAFFNATFGIAFTAASLMIAEVLGILEEIFDKRKE